MVVRHIGNVKVVGPIPTWGSISKSRCRTMEPFAFFHVSEKSDEILGLKYLFMSYDVNIIPLSGEDSGFVVEPLNNDKELPEDFLDVADGELEVFLADETRTCFVVVSHTQEIYYLVRYEDGVSKRVALDSEQLRALLIDELDLSKEQVKLMPAKPEVDLLEKIWSNTLN